MNISCCGILVIFKTRTSSGFIACNCPNITKVYPAGSFLLPQTETSRASSEASDPLSPVSHTVGLRVGDSKLEYLSFINLFSPMQTAVGRARRSLHVYNTDQPRPSGHNRWKPSYVLIYAVKHCMCSFKQGWIIKTIIHLFSSEGSHWHIDIDM